MKEPITYVTITQNRADNLKRNLPKALPYVDRVVVIDGGSQDDTEAYCKSLGDKVEWYYHEWEDSFAKQWNNYLKYVNEGWILLLDDDEVPTDELMEELPKLVEESKKGENFSCVEFRSWSINPNDDPPKDHPDDYWRKIFFRYAPGMKYVVDLHQCLVGYQNNRHVRSDLIYHHIKTPRDVARNACRNYFISGVWPSGVTEGIKGAEWEEFHNIVKKSYPTVKTFNDLDVFFIKGGIDEDLKEWLIKHKDFGSNLYHELHHYYEYYFEMLHPEEVTKEVEERVEHYASIPKKFLELTLECDAWSAKGDSRELGVALHQIAYVKDGKQESLSLVNPSLELEGFNGVESVRNDIQFAWSTGKSVIRIHGIDEVPDEMLIKFLWPAKPDQKVFITVDGKKVEVVGRGGLHLRKKKE